MTKIIVTGAGGLVGLNLLALMEIKHNDIIAIDKNINRINLIRKLFPKINAHCIDLTHADVKKWQHLFADASTVIQLQAQIHALNEQPYWDNNVDSVKQVIAAMPDNCHLIHISSSVVISIADDLYVQTKRAGENLVLESRLPYTILRPSLMYGCFDYKHLGVLTKLMEKLPVVPIPGHGKYIRQPLYVIDFCNIILNTIDKHPEQKIYNIIGKEQIYFIDLLKKIRRRYKLKCYLLPLPLGVFAFLVRLWGMLFGKAPFVKEQILALTAGDIFPYQNWEEEFKVKYTTFDTALENIINSKYNNYRSGHDE